MHICALQSEANVDKQQTFRRETTEQKGFTNCGKTREKLTSNSSKNCGGKFVTFSSLPMRIHEKRSKQNYRRSKMVALHVERKTREKKIPRRLSLGLKIAKCSSMRLPSKASTEKRVYRLGLARKSSPLLAASSTYTEYGALCLCLAPCKSHALSHSSRAYAANRKRWVFLG